jgi:ATP-dependent helicase/nuclease subunit A
MEYVAHYDNDIAIKAKAFLYKLDYFRNLVPYTPIHELIQQVLADTGYYNYIYANADGDRRRMNLDMLVEKAIAYEKTSYKGLFNFIRFIEKMVKFDIDFGEASALGTNDNFVRVMTIHKSKGLEFPVVFVAGMGTKFNMMDLRSKVIIHPDLGIAPDYVDTKLRIKCPTLMKNVVANVIKEETIAEELRILYVALTRAREKLSFQV